MIRLYGPTAVAGIVVAAGYAAMAAGRPGTAAVLLLTAGVVCMAEAVRLLRHCRAVRAEYRAALDDDGSEW